MIQKIFFTASIFLLSAVCYVSAAPQQSCPDGNNSQSKQKFSKGVVYEEITCSNGTKLLIERKFDKNAKSVYSSKSVATAASAKTSTPPAPKIFLNEQVDMTGLFPQQFYDSEEKRLIKIEDKSNTAASPKSGLSINAPLSVDSQKLENWNQGQK